MKNKIYSAFIVLFSVILASLALPCTAFAQSIYQYTGYKVHVYVYGYEGLISEGDVYAYTFENAIQKLAADDHRLDIVFSRNGSKNTIYSINGITNRTFGTDDGWYGYVLRNGRLVQQTADYLSINLWNNDSVVLYYGDSFNTKLLLGSFHTVKDDILTFTAVSEKASSSEDNDEPGIEVNYIQGVNIHLFLPGGVLKLLRTEEAGSVSTTINKLGVYKYYAEGYVSGSYPAIVRTDYNYFMYGIKNDKAITRAEAAAFIVNHFDVKPGRKQNTLNDIDRSSPLYDEINTAITAGIISGYEDGSFRGANTVTLLQLSVMIAQLYPDYKPTFYLSDFGDLPEWARTYVATVYENRLLSGVKLNWYNDVTSDMLLQIYQNAKK